MSERVLVVCGLSTEAVQDLRARGHLVEPADDGYRTIELVERVHPHAVLYDITASGPPVPELLERVRQIESTCRVLLLVPDSDPERDAEFVAAGADGLVVASSRTPFLEWAVARAAGGGLVLDPHAARGLGQALT